jgi:hypothetical protein
MGNQFLTPTTLFYSNLSSPSGIANYDLRCMQFEDFAGIITAGALI